MFENYPKNQIIVDMPFDEYKSIKAINQSTIKEILENPFYYCNGVEKPRTESKALDFGSLMHDLILTPDEIGLKYQILKDIDKIDLRNKEHKALKEQADRDGKTLIDGTLWAETQAILEINGDVFKAFFDNGYKEAVWLGDLQSGEKSHFCKARFDFLDDERNIVDLKFVQSSKKADFIKAVANFGYHIQAKFYMDLINARSFTFVAVEKKYPYMVGLYQLDSVSLDFARKKIDEAFEIVSKKEKYQKNVWLDKEFENNAVQTISLPSFAFYE